MASTAHISSVEGEGRRQTTVMQANHCYTHHYTSGKNTQAMNNFLTGSKEDCVF